MIYVTGDCHADFSKFSVKRFPEQREMTRNDYVIVCGDFGLWHDNPTERYWLKWLAQRKFTLLFVDGNHENFDRLYSDEFPIIDFCGGKAHRIRKNIYHLMRGQVFTLQGKKFFTFGGASSHDIDDGIIDPEEFNESVLSFTELMHSEDLDARMEYNKCIRKLRGEMKRRRAYDQDMCRIDHLSWWKQEMPSSDEYKTAYHNLRLHRWKVDYIITHCCPQNVASYFSRGLYQEDELTSFFDEVARLTKFKKWYFGHYHNNDEFFGQYVLLYQRIERIL